MNAQQIVALASRIFAIWLATYAIRFVVSALGTGARLTGANAIVLCSMALGMAGVALLVWLCPLAIATKVLPRTQYANIVHMPARQVAALAAATLGLWVVIDAISNIAAVISFVEQPSFLFTPKELLYILTAFAPMAIGCYLLKYPFVVADKVLPVRAAAEAKAAAPE